MAQRKSKRPSAILKDPGIYSRVREILDAARMTVARSVNSTQVIANWLIGREIVREEQQGRRRAEYGQRLMCRLAQRIERDFGPGYGLANLKLFRQFFLNYPDLAGEGKGYAPRSRLLNGPRNERRKKGYALRSQLGASSSFAIQRSHSVEFDALSDTTSMESWTPGLLNPNLSWTHYRALIRVEDQEARSFYEIESIKSNWSARELERQIGSLLYERLAMSRDKKGLLRLASKGHEIQSATDVFKDPMVVEFLGLPMTSRLVESELETALIDNIQAFLLELGKGFAFVARQQRITLDGDHFYIDLVFYHTILKCFVLIDLKVGKLTHGDLGQLQLYVNYYDRQRLSPGDNPTLGLILCTDKNEAVVRYTLGQQMGRQISVSRYKLHVPTEAELKAELRRELGAFRHRKKS